MYIDKTRIASQVKFMSSQSVCYDGPSVKEKINLNLFSLSFIGERKKKFHRRLLGRENEFDFFPDHYIETREIHNLDPIGTTC